MKTMMSSPSPMRNRIIGVAAAVLLTAGALAAQSPAARIQAEIDSSQMTPVPGTQNGLARVAVDLGRMPADTRLSHITLRFNRSAAQEAALNALIAAQLNPSSPQYHQWLTPDQFAARFGVAQSDMDKVASWLEQQGFTVDGANRSHTAIQFTGTVAQVESAFATQMHYYQVGGGKHFAPSTALSVPAALAPVVADIHNLDDFRPRADHIRPRANFTSGQTGDVFFSPGDIVTTYDISPLYNAGVHGEGQTITVVGQSSVVVSDIENFQNAAGLNVKDPNLIEVPGTGSATAVPGDEAEGDLDLEWAGALAPGANIIFLYTGNDPNFGAIDAADYAVDQSIGTIINISFSICEPDPGMTSAYVSSQENIFQQAATQGQTVLAASGDQGSAACYGDPDVGNTLAEQSQESVNYPASSAYVTGVGGTEITTDDVNGGPDYSMYWSTNGSNDVISSALKYIPEVAWNDNSANCGQQDCLSASGGGTSILISRPAWQSGVPGIPSGTMRLVPDIAFYASPALPGYLFCTSDQSFWAQSQTGSCGSGFRASSSDSSLTVAGGTSFASPVFASMLALLNESAKFTTGAGLVNPTLYTLAANSATYAAAFHDVTLGNNNCDVSADCSSDVGYSAGPGYDQVTGLGSVDLGVLANDWPANTGGSAALTGTVVSVQAANATPDVNQSDVFTITVTTVGGTAVTGGTVTLQVDGGNDCGGLATSCGGTTVPNQSLNSSGQVTYNATFTTAGVHSIVAQYSGTSTYGASTGAGSVTIAVTSSGKGSISAGASPATLTVPQGSQGSETITVTPAGGYTGTVTVSVDFGSNDNALSNLCLEFSPANTAGLGTVQITGTTAGSVQLILDTNASDCVSDARRGSGQLRNFLPMRNLVKGGAARNTPPAPARSPLPPALALAGLALAGYLGRRSRSIRNLVVVLALAAAGLLMSACGSSSSTSGVSNPPKGTYTATITATDSTTNTITSTTAFTFVID